MLFLLYSFNLFPKLFSTGTMDSELIHVTGDGHSIDKLKEEHNSFLCALSAHPSQDLVAMGGYTGKIKVWDYTRHRVLATCQFPSDSLVFCLTYDSSGGALAVGMTDGSLYVLDAITLRTVSGPLKFSHECVTKIIFSADNRYLALCDADCCVVVYSGTAAMSAANGKTVDWTYSYLGSYVIACIYIDFLIQSDYVQYHLVNTNTNGQSKCVRFIRSFGRGDFE